MSSHYPSLIKKTSNCSTKKEADASFFMSEGGEKMLKAIVVAPDDYEELEKLCREYQKAVCTNYYSIFLVPEKEPLDVSLSKGVSVIGDLFVSYFKDPNGYVFEAREGDHTFPINIRSRSSYSSISAAKHGLRALMCTLWFEVDFTPEIGWVVSTERGDLFIALSEYKQVLFATYTKEFFPRDRWQVTGIQKGYYIPVTPKRFIVANDDMVVSVALNERLIKTNRLIDADMVLNDRALARKLVSNKYFEQ